MLSGLSYLQPVLLQMPVLRRSVFCLSAHSSSLLCPVFYALYSVPSLFEHPYTGSSSATPFFSPDSISFHVSVEIHSLSSFFFLPNDAVQVSFPIAFKDFQRSSTQISSGPFLDISHFVLMADVKISFVVSSFSFRVLYLNCGLSPTSVKAFNLIWKVSCTS
ncbi:unnamed protein product [Heterobilharzia americana]|nr:unnamed protein product [Heterobilharzia americana]